MYFMRLNAIGYFGFHMSDWFYAGDFINMDIIVAFSFVVIYAMIEQFYYEAIVASRNKY